MSLGRSQSALFAEQTYEMVGKGGKQRRISRINKNIEKTGFRVAGQYSGRDVVAFVNDETKQLHISHRGTDISGKRTKQDLHSDFNIAMGTTAKDAHFKTRTAKTQEAVDAFPDYSVTASGHSLGGKSLTTSLATNKKLRERITHADTFNSGATVFKERELRNLSDDGVKQMKDKIVHHRTQGDIVSKAMTFKKPMGRVKTYREKKDKTPDQSEKLSVGLGNVLRVENAAEALHAHKMDHFYNKFKYHDEE